MKRILLFARSVIPQDPTQLFLLAGSGPLLICIQLRCYPVTLGNARPNPLSDAWSWLGFSILARVPIFLAGAAGLFICFWPGIHPARRMFLFVLLPSFTGIAAICGRFLYVSQLPDFPRESVMLAGSHNEAWAFSTVWSLGPALHMSVLGFLSALIFFSRLATGVSRLPVHLVHNEGVLPGDDKAWKRILVFLWISIACMAALGSLAGLLVFSIYEFF